jgi:hypothetical protein
MNMDEMYEQIINEQVEENKTEGFRIDDDGKAEWALKKIAQEKQELKKYNSVCDAMIDEYNAKKIKAEQKYENNTQFLRDQLQEYFGTVERKRTKTQENYKLPSGKLVLSYPKVKFVRDEEILTNWLENNQLDEFVKIKKSTDWKELKKKVQVSGSSIVTEDGEVVDGIIAEETEAEFKVEV